MKEKIEQLLACSNIQDVAIGWELLNLPENKPKGEEWYYWWNIMTSYYATKEIGDFVNQCIGEVVQKKYWEDPLWLKWDRITTIKERNKK